MCYLICTTSPGVENDLRVGHASTEPLNTTAKQIRRDEDYVSWRDMLDLRKELAARFKEIDDRLDDHSERLGRMEDLLVEINQKL